MPKKATEIIAYLSPIGFIVSFLLGDREDCKFHLNQALVLNILFIVVEGLEKLLEWIPLIGGIIGLVLAIIAFILFILWLIGIIGAIQGQEKEIPILGHIKLLK